MLSIFGSETIEKILIWLIVCAVILILIIFIMMLIIIIRDRKSMLLVSNQRLEKLNILEKKLDEISNITYAQTITKKTKDVNRIIHMAEKNESTLEKKVEPKLVKVGNNEKKIQTKLKKPKEVFTTVTKIDFLNDIDKRIEGTNKDDIERFINAFKETLTEELIKGNSLTVKGMGNFHVVQIVERTGINPRTGDAIVIPGTKKVSLKWSSKVKEYINK